MPLKDFTEEAYQGLAAKKEEVVVGLAKNWYDSFETTRQEQFQGLIKMMAGK